MFFDLNVPVPGPPLPVAHSKKGKGKATQQQQQQPGPALYTPAQISAIEARVDLLVHLGYTVLALTQTTHTKVDPKTHTNAPDALLAHLRPRPGIIFLKRLTIVLDEASEHGFGLTPANAALFHPYDLLALVPTTPATFSLACLTHSAPSPLTAHLIALPLTSPRPPFHLKHSLIRTALKNGVVFELSYAAALGSDADARRNWWASARELVRVTRGRGLVVSGGAAEAAHLRAPRDAANLIVLLGLAPDAAHGAATKTPKAVVLRAQTRRTYRSVLSEPKVLMAAGAEVASGTEVGEKKRKREEEEG